MEGIVVGSNYTQKIEVFTGGHLFVSERAVSPVIAGLAVGISLIVLFTIVLKPALDEPRGSTTNNTKLPYVNALDNTTKNGTRENMTELSVVRISGTTSPTIVSRPVISEYAILDELMKGTDIKYEKCHKNGSCPIQDQYSETKEAANITISEAINLIKDHRLELAEPCYDDGGCAPHFYSNMRIDGAFYQVMISDLGNKILKDLIKQYSQ